MATPEPQPKNVHPARTALPQDEELLKHFHAHSLEALIEAKIVQFLDKVGDYHPERLHEMMLTKVERPLLRQVLWRTGGNQVRTAKILGINRNTLRKKMKIFGLN